MESLLADSAPAVSRGQSRRYSLRPHSPSVPGRKVRRICPSHILSLPAPVGPSRPRLYLIFRYHIIFYLLFQERI